MKSIFSLLMCLFLLSCGVDSTEIGADFFQVGKLDISMIDSATVNFSTVMIDDISSNGKDRLIVGSYLDERLGRISCLAFLQFGISSAVRLPTPDVDYESLQLVLKNDGYSFYDTATTLKLNIYKLTESVDPDENGRLYTSDSFTYSQEILGVADLYPRPNRTAEYEIPLSDVLGRTIFDKAQQSDSDLSDNTEFTEFLKGLVLVPDENTSSSLVGLTSDVELRLYYRDRSAVPTDQKYISFPLNSSSSFTHTRINRENTALSELTQTSQRITAEETDGISYIQGGTALALRIDLPYLRKFRQYPNFYLTKAVLQFAPVRKSFDGMRPLYPNLLAFRVDESNEVYNTSSFAASLVTDYSLSRDTYYEIDVTTFVKEQMDLVSVNGNGLIFIFSETELNASRLCVASPSNLYTTKLKVYYATINE